MIRKMTENDRELYIRMAEEFYSSDAVLHPVPHEYFERTADEALRSDAYAEIYLLEYEGRTAGYGLTARTFSQEAGGQVLWIEELSLSEAMKRLPERENYIISLRFFEGKTQMEVAEEIGISQAQVSRLEKNALKSMRNYLKLG